MQSKQSNININYFGKKKALSWILTFGFEDTS